MADYLVTINGRQYRVTAPNQEVVTEAARRFDEWMGGNREVAPLPPGASPPPAVPNEGAGMPGGGAGQDALVERFGRFLEGGIRELRPLTEKISDWTRDVGNALTFGNFNELVAGADNLLGNRDNMTFQDRLAYEDRQDALHRQENPVATTAIDLAGGLATPVAMMRSGASFLRGARPSASSIVPRSVLEGAGYGAVAGFGQGEGFDPVERGRNALAGAGVGGATGGIFGTIGGSLANRSAVASAPTREALGTATDAAFDTMRSAGVRFNSNSFDNLLQTIDAELQGANVAAIPGSGAGRWLGILNSRQGQAPTMDELQTLRSNLQSDIRDAQRGTNPNGNDIRLMEGIVRRMDEYMLDPAAPIVGGNLAAGQSALTEGRSLSLASRKSGVIAEAMAAARRAAGERVATPSSRQAALASEFRQIADNPEMRRMFNAEELSIIDEIAGGRITETTLRNLGRLAPSNAIGGLGGLLPAAVGLGGIAASAGTVPAIAAAGAGEIGARVSNSMTRQNAALVDALARSRGSAAANPAIIPLIQALTATGASQAISADPTQALLNLLLPPRQDQQIPWRQ